MAKAIPVSDVPDPIKEGAVIFPDEIMVPEVVKDVPVFVRSTVFVVELCWSVTCCRFPTPPPVPAIPVKALPSPMNFAPDVRFISIVAVLLFSKASWSVDAVPPEPLYFCILRAVLQPVILINTNDYFHGKIRHFPLVKSVGSSDFCFGILKPP